MKHLKAANPSSLLLLLLPRPRFLGAATFVACSALVLLFGAALGEWTGSRVAESRRRDMETSRHG